MKRIFRRIRFDYRGGYHHPVVCSGGYTGRRIYSRRRKSYALPILIEKSRVTSVTVPPGFQAPDGMSDPRGIEGMVQTVP